MELKKLNLDDLDAIVSLEAEFNPYVAAEKMAARVAEMFHYGDYHCFGALRGRELIGLAGCRVTGSVYFGKQMTIDDFIISAPYQARGIGKELLAYVEHWARAQGCRSVGLNTYVTNAGSHKFYFNRGYTILGYHFQKPLGKPQSAAATQGEQGKAK